MGTRLRLFGFCIVLVGTGAGLVASSVATRPLEVYADRMEELRDLEAEMGARPLSFSVQGGDVISLELSRQTRPTVQSTQPGPFRLRARSMVQKESAGPAQQATDLRPAPTKHEIAVPASGAYTASVMVQRGEVQVPVALEPTELSRRPAVTGQLVDEGSASAVRPVADRFHLAGAQRYLFVVPISGGGDMRIEVDWEPSDAPGKITLFRPGTYDAPAIWRPGTGGVISNIRFPTPIEERWLLEIVSLPMQRSVNVGGQTVTLPTQRTALTGTLTIQWPRAEDGYVVDIERFLVEEGNRLEYYNRWAEYHATCIQGMVNWFEQWPITELEGPYTGCSSETTRQQFKMLLDILRAMHERQAGAVRNIAG